MKEETRRYGAAAALFGREGDRRGDWRGMRRPCPADRRMRDKAERRGPWESEPLKPAAHVDGLARDVL